MSVEIATRLNSFASIAFALAVSKGKPTTYQMKTELPLLKDDNS